MVPLMVGSATSVKVLHDMHLIKNQTKNLICLRCAKYKTKAKFSLGLHLNNIFYKPKNAEFYALQEKNILKLYEIIYSCYMGLFINN